MWQVFMIVPVRNDGSPVQEGLRKGRRLAARGMVRLDEMYIKQFESKREARLECIKLAQKTIADKGHNTTIVGFGIRHRLAKKRSKLLWECTLQQVHVELDRIYKRHREAYEAGQAQQVSA